MLVSITRCRSLERENELPMSFTHRRDRESVATFQQQHSIELTGFVLTQFIERDDALEAPLELHVDHKPARIVTLRARIVVIALLVELRGIRIRGTYYLHDTRDSRFGSARVIDEREIALAEVVAQHVARLVVAHAVPHGGLPGFGGEMVDAKSRRLSLHQPIVHRSPSR